MKRFVVMLSVSVLLTGCLGDMPSSGPIGYGRANSVASESNFVRTIVTPPVAGADPAVIVRGFMTASAGDSGTFSTARQYLAPEVRQEWRPLAEIRVVQDRGLAWEYDNVRSPGLVRFTANQVGTINTYGEYRGTLSGQLATEFRLRLVNQEWRISALPDGLTLSQTELDRTYRSVAVYFPDRTGSVLVPNVLYLPVRPALPTAMVRALLRGPSPWLAPSVRTAIPLGTSLRVNAVPVVDGVAVIDLSDNVARASSADRVLLSAQLVHTLRQVSGIRSIRITADGADLSVPGIGRVQPINSWDGLGPDVANSDSLLYFTTETGLHTISLNDPQAQPRPLSASVADYTRGLRWPAVSLERDRLLALDSSGNVVTGDLSRGPADAVSVSGLAVLLSASGREFFRPKFDLTATYWVAAVGTRQLQVYAGRIGGVPLRVQGADMGGGVTTAFAISRDGARAVVARSANGRSLVYVLRVVRTGRGLSEQFSLQDPRLIGSVFGSVTDLAWLNAVQVAALGGQVGQSRQVWTLSLDGQAPKAVGPTLAAVSLAAAPGRPIIVETADQGLVILRDQRWSQFTSGRDPSFSG